MQFRNIKTLLWVAIITQKGCDSYIIPRRGFITVLPSSEVEGRFRALSAGATPPRGAALAQLVEQRIRNA